MATNSAVGSATQSSTWQAADALTAAQGGAGQVATPRWPGAIPSTEHAASTATGGPFGTAPDYDTSGEYAADLPWLADPGVGGTASPVQPEGTGLPGRPSPNGVPEHDGYGGNAQVMAQHGQDDGSAAEFARAPRGGVSLAPMVNLINNLLPTDWRLTFTPQGQYTSYTFDRPSMGVQQMSDRDMVPHEVGYEAAPIYVNLAKVARQQDQVNSIYAPDGGTPDMTPYQNNDGNPIYEAPPDPQTTSGNNLPSTSGYSFGDLYG